MRLYLAGLDAIAAQLDLLINPAQILDLAVAALERPIAGAVEAMGTTVESQLDKSLLGSLRQIEVATSKTQTTQAELTGHTDGAEVAPFVQDQRF
ncbi:hypothetical protein D3C75_973410 [compost metagenome]